MSKDDKINIKLEVCKDKTSGKLLIMAHFNSNAPNVYQDKSSYYWMPTIEEKDFINEAFELIPMDRSGVITEKTTQKEEIKEEKTKPETKFEPEFKLEPKANFLSKPKNEPETKSKPVLQEEIKTTIETKPPEEKTKPTNLPPLEKPNDKDIFEVTDEQIKGDDIEMDKENKIENIIYKKEEKSGTSFDDEDTNNKDKDDGIIVEADNEAIENALKKHTEKDKSIVEADEQTIIDRVLSQKKKGKWSKR